MNNLHPESKLVAFIQGMKEKDFLHHVNKSLSYIRKFLNVSFFLNIFILVAAIYFFMNLHDSDIARPLLKVQPSEQKFFRETASVLRNSDYYRQYSGKNVFKRHIAKPVKKIEKPKVPKIPISVRIKGLNLVGIMKKGNLWEAVLEDINANQTYYLTEGDSVRELNVVSVSEDTLKLGDGEETIDLRL